MKRVAILILVFAFLAPMFMMPQAAAGEREDVTLPAEQEWLSGVELPAEEPVKSQTEHLGSDYESLCLTHPKESICRFF